MIPTLDWAEMARAPDAFARALGAACRGPGFFLLTGHGIAPGLIAETFAAGDRFFALPEAEKAPLGIEKTAHNRGWVADRVEMLDPASGQTDRKEAFNIGLDLSPDDARVRAGEPFRGVNVWPDLPGFRATTLRYFEAAWALGVALHRPIARDLGLADDWFAQHFTAPLATLRLLSYPAGGAEMGAGAHTDYGSLTLLMTDGVAALQVRPRDGDWIDVPQVPDAFVVNIGDCLMRWTNDVYVSTPHRVLAPRRRRRSLAFFLDPNPDSVIEAVPGTGVPRYPPVTGAAYLQSRLAPTYQ
ncbi:MAG: 2-oxoglutarate and iron-dependent oxygenase domain-containing protein [Pseudomonadota bacterium]